MTESQSGVRRLCLCGCDTLVTYNTARVHGRRKGAEHDCMRCMMCNDIIDGHPHTGRGLVIHHVDEDVWNNTRTNLMPLHKSCHISWHSVGNAYNVGRRHKPETIRKMQTAQLGDKHHMYGKHHTVESRARISAGGQGKKRSAKTRQRMSDAQRVKTPCPDCGVSYSRQQTTQHKRKENCL